MPATTHSNASEARLFNLSESARFLGLTPRTIQNLIARGVLRPVRIAGLRRTLLDRKDLEHLVESAGSERVPGAAI